MSERTRRDVLALAALALLGSVGPAAAAEPRPSRVVVPDPLPAPDTLPSLPISVVSRSLDGISEQRDDGHVLDLTLDANLLFGKDSAALRPESLGRLHAIAADLARRPAGRVVISGHTDDLGTEAHALDLSRRRAEAVRAALGAGLSRHIVAVHALGESQPRVPNTSEQNRARNRRVEVRFTAGRR